MRGETPLHHLALVERLIVRSLLGAGYAIVGRLPARPMGGRGGPFCPYCWSGRLLSIKRAGGEGLIGVDARRCMCRAGKSMSLRIAPVSTSAL